MFTKYFFIFCRFKGKMEKKWRKMERKKEKNKIKSKT
jgi:hypothetical protein